MTDSDSLSVTTLLMWNESITLPSWLNYDENTFTFNISYTSPSDIGNHKFTLYAYDGFNYPVNSDFYIKIEQNDPPVKEESIPNFEIMNYHNLDVTFQDIEVLFSDPNSLVLTASMRQSNNNPLPPFLSFDPSSNKLTGTPTVDDVGTWNLKYVATNTNQNEGHIAFVLKVLGRILNK